MEKVLPHAMLKAKPNLESRIRTLKEDWAIIYDLLRGKDNSGFGWDKHRHMVVAEDVIWDSYIVYKEVGRFKTQSFLYYEQFTSIYAKDRAIRKYAQIAIDIVEELCAEDVANERNLEEGSNENGCKFDVSLNEMDVSATQSQPSNPNKADSTFSKKKKKMSGVSEPIYSTSVIDATTSLEDNIRTICLELSRSIAFEMLIHEKSKMVIQEKVQTLYVSLGEIEGLTDDE
ncbi:hypothetical protein Gogos_021509 [Gossypium gossypioides]|uniref:Myb/SANT-like domain-containing protein n=1 Tax=Gossypium gossypioides TaxID=34282 RepID=A0A7J9D650_GOSGO|nr:hypothetical protein [Gossypium gossypioides]